MSKKSSQRVVKALVQGFFQQFPEEASRYLESLPVQEIVRLLEAEPISRLVGLLEHLTPDTAARVIIDLRDETARGALSALDPDRAATLLSRSVETERNRLLGLLDPAKAKTLRSIMTFPLGTAGRLMDPRVMTFIYDTPVREVLSRLRASHRNRITDLFIVDADGIMTGAVPLQEVVFAKPFEPIGGLLRGEPIRIDAMSTREEVVELMEQRRLASLPVVDFEGRLLGVIRQDVLVKAAQEELSADLQTMVGASKEERALSRVSFAVQKRLPWLQINLATAFLAAAVVGLFEGIIAKFTALAVLLPVVAGQSGNTGAQALAVMMRGLALREVRAHQWMRVLRKEAQVAFINGCSVALTTSLAVYLWSHSSGLALIIGVSMVLSMVAAGLSGVTIPVLLTSLGQDPAQSSSIILTTVTDVVGFFSFLGIATLLSAFI